MHITGTSEAPHPPSAADTVYAEVKRRILAGALVAGTMLSEGEFATELAFSRTPVREAFLRLQSEGWLRLYPKRGALVVPPAAGESADLLDARRLLENHAAQAVAADAEARRRLAATLADIVDVQRAAADRTDLDAFLDADADFHAEIMRAGGNRLLSDVATGLRERQRRLTSHAVRTPERMRTVIADHVSLAEAIDSGDANAFRRLFDEHLHRSYL